MVKLLGLTVMGGHLGVKYDRERLGLAVEVLSSCVSMEERCHSQLPVG